MKYFAVVANGLKLLLLMQENQCSLVIVFQVSIDPLKPLRFLYLKNLFHLSFKNHTFSYKIIKEEREKGKLTVVKAGSKRF